MNIRAPAVVAGAAPRERAALEKLLRHIEDQCSAQCRSIETEAAEAADRVVSEARLRAARMLRTARRRERLAVREDVRTAAAQQRARLRHAWMERRRDLAEHAMSRLRQILQQLWRDDPEARRQWIASALQQARRALPKIGWKIEIPSGFEVDGIRAELHDAAPEALDWMACEDLEAGVRIRAGHALLDMSVSGLLARPDQVAGRMLAQRPARPPELEAGES